MRTYLIVAIAVLVGLISQVTHAGVAVTPIKTRVNCFAYDQIHGNILIDIYKFEDHTNNIYITVENRNSGERLFDRDGKGVLNRWGTGHVNYLTPGGAQAGYQIWVNFHGRLQARFHLNGRWSNSIIQCQLKK